MEEGMKVDVEGIWVGGCFNNGMEYDTIIYRAKHQNPHLVRNQRVKPTFSFYISHIPPIIPRAPGCSNKQSKKC